MGATACDRRPGPGTAEPGGGASPPQPPARPQRTPKCPEKVGQDAWSVAVLSTGTQPGVAAPLLPRHAQHQAARLSLRATGSRPSTEHQALAPTLNSEKFFRTQVALTATNCFSPALEGTRSACQHTPGVRGHVSRKRHSIPPAFLSSLVSFSFFRASVSSVRSPRPCLSSLRWLWPHLLLAEQWAELWAFDGCVRAPACVRRPGPGHGRARRRSAPTTAPGPPAENPKVSREGRPRPLERSSA